MSLLEQAEQTSARFVAARWFTRGRRAPVRVVVIHTAETLERSNSAENLAGYFRTTGNRVSAHWCVDNNSVVQCVRESDTAYAAPGANHDGIQIELAGVAAQSRTQWNDAYSQRMLAIAARLTAEICDRHGVPVTQLSTSALRGGSRRGIAGHVDVNRAFRRSTHTDPGPNFPWAAFLSQVADHLERIRGGGDRVLRAGSRGAAVMELQRLLTVLGYRPGPIDGDFGSRTTAAVRAFQRDRGLTIDGVVGPATSAALTQAPSRPYPGVVLRYRRFRTMRGDSVRLVQQSLEQKGYDVGAVDGVFGRRTDAAVRSFQRDRGLTIDGKVGPLTWDLLV